jgi:hypothetical protein
MTTARGTRQAAARIRRTKGHAFVRGRVWYAMRTLRTFRLSELVAVAEAPSRDSVQTFLSLLRRAGYIHPRHLNRGKHEETVFTLVRNTGPLCPAVLNRGKAVWDYNTETEYSTQ